MKTTPLLIGAAVAAGLAWTIYSTGREFSRPLEIMNPDGKAGTALLVYHPGLSDFPERVAGAIAQGLVETGWRVESTTASAQAPADLAPYDILVLESPTYWWAPARAVTHYIERVGDLGGKRVMLTLTGAGQAERALRLLRGQVERANGRVVEQIALFTWRPNSEVESETGDNKEIAYRIATAVARNVAPPCRVECPPPVTR